jgi:hypothetical protein
MTIDQHMCCKGCLQDVRDTLLWLRYRDPARYQGLIDKLDYILTVLLDRDFVHHICTGQCTGADSPAPLETEVPMPHPHNARRAASSQPVYVPCTHCAEPVVIAAIADGTAVVLDAQAPTYALLWNPGAVQAVVVPTHAFAVHACGRVSPAPGTEGAR